MLAVGIIMAACSKPSEIPPLTPTESSATRELATGVAASQPPASQSPEVAVTPTVAPVQSSESAAPPDPFFYFPSDSISNLPEGAVARLGIGHIRPVSVSPDGAYIYLESVDAGFLYTADTLEPV